MTEQQKIVKQYLRGILNAEQAIGCLIKLGMTRADAEAAIG